MNDVLNQIFEQSQSFLAPMVRTNQLAVANLEQLVNFQVKSLESYVVLSLERLKAAAEVNDLDSLQVFANGQVETANILRQKMLDDGQALAELLTGFKTEFEKLAEENVAELNDKVNKAVKQAA